MRIPLITVIILFLLSFLCDWTIWSDIRHKAHRKIWSRLYAVSAVVCWIFLIVTLCLPRRSQDDGILTVMWMLYSYSTVYIAKTVYTIFSLLGRIPRLWGARARNLGLWAGMPLGLLTFICMWWGVFVTRHELQVNRVEIVSERIPKPFDGYRITQFSDAHVGTWGNDTTFISALVDSVNATRPDLIVFTGDIVNRETGELEPFLKVLRRLKAKDGVISVLGNHDYGDYVDWRHPSERDANNALLAVWQRQMGWRLLNNTHTFLTRDSDSIAIIGVENWGEPPFHQYGRLDKAYPHSADTAASLTDARYKILLSHNPEHWNREVTDVSNIDLTLSGHTHAMQMMVSVGDWKWSPSQYRYEYWGGLYSRGRADGGEALLYVNIGCGEVAIPFRIGATPEITLFTLRHSDSVKGETIKVNGSSKK